MTTVALDLLGGDGAPDVIADAVALVMAEPDHASLILVGPTDVAVRLLRERGVSPDDVRFESASRSVRMDEDPLRVLRAHPDVTVSVAARLVAQGRADA